MNIYPSIDRSVIKNFIKQNKIKVNKKKFLPTIIDKKISEEVIYIYYRLKNKVKHRSEWSWINKFKRSNLINSLEKKDINELAKIFSNFFLNNASYGIISWDYNQLKYNKKKIEFKSNVYRDYSTWNEFVKKKSTDIKYLKSEKKFGNCYGVDIDNSLVMIDTPRHDYFASKIIDLVGNSKSKKILEIGGGYGGLIFQLLKRKFKGTIINVDIPETLIISYYFLKKFGKKKIIICDLEKNIKFKPEFIYLCTPNYFLNLDLKIDLICNFHSFSEMSKHDLFNYINKINRMDLKYLLHQNSNILLYPNSKRHIEILADRFPINIKKFKQVGKNISLWVSGSGRYREYLYKKR